MKITNRIVALLKGKAFQRVVSIALCVCLCFSVFAKNFTKAEAAVGTVSAGYAALSAYLQAGGIFMVVDAGGAAAASSAVAAAAETAVAAGAVAGHTSASSVATAIAAGTTISASGAIILTVAAAALCAGIYAYWRSTLADTGSQEIVYSDNQLGNLVLASAVPNSDMPGAIDFTAFGTPFSSVGDRVLIGDNIYLVLDAVSSGSATFRFRDSEGNLVRSKTLNNSSFLSNYYFPCTRTNNGPIEVSAEHPIYAGVLDVLWPSPRITFFAYYSDAERYLYSSRNGSFSDSQLYFMPAWVEGLTSSVVVSSASLSNPSGTVDIAIPDGKQTLTLPDVVPAGTTIDSFPDFVYQELANGNLTVGPPTVSSPPGYDEFDPPLPEQGPVQDPTNPGTDIPYLPGTLPIPWHYVERALAYAASFISLCMVTFNELIPSSVSDVIWAAVVLGVLFGLIKRFLG